MTVVQPSPVASASSEAGSTVDPVTQEIVRNAMKSIAERVTRRMIRAANSFIVKEMEDCSASLLDARGQLIAEEAGPPIQLNTVGVCLKTILEHCIPASEWKPGDVVVTNDPFAGNGSLAATHSNDYLAFSPIFFEDELVAFAGLMVHHMDIGAMNMGSRGWGVDIYQEGLRVPPMKLVDGGRLEQKVMDVILTNTRVRDILENDLIAQFASVQVAVNEVDGLFRKYGKPVMLGCFNAMMDYSERRTRAELERIPDGTYTHEEPVLDDGAKGGPFWLRATITKKGGDVTIDLTGTDPQIAGPINCPLATTTAAIYYAMRCITDPTISGTEGCKRPIKIIAPEGSLVNAQSPAAVMQRMVVCHSLVDLIMGAFAAVIPERVMGDSCGCLYNYSICDDPNTGRRTMFGEVVPGGLGANDRFDGIDAMACHVTNCHVPPIEAMEIEQPVLYLRRELRSGSGGAGRRRGGTGYVLAYKILGGRPQLHRTSQKSRSLPQGVDGGLPGDGGRWVINEGTDKERTLPYAIGDIEALETGDTVTHYTPGGGGFGDPRKRAPESVQRDVQFGFVSCEEAERLYGVTLDPATLTITKTAQ
jgi:N-methylhydantoinase B